MVVGQFNRFSLFCNLSLSIRGSNVKLESTTGFTGDRQELWFCLERQSQALWNQ